jgi:GTPase Era involved in 16S rRNA processing
MTSQYRASKTRSSRPGWSATFRHPVRTDSRGQRGLKVRRGLGTTDEAEAEKYIEELDQLLANESWWSGDRRTDAERQFSPVVVAAFFDGIEAGDLDSVGRREAFIRMPNRESGYSQILFLGTTGAGKTTLLRHVIGSDPAEDRFPSTSTARTTTADIEIVMADEPFRAAVTFMPEHEVRAHIDECLEEACSETVQGRSNAKIMAALLQHREQRFRLSYILGTWSDPSAVDDSDFNFDEQEDDPLAEIDESETTTPEEDAKNHSRLAEYLRVIRTLSAEVEAKVTGTLGALKDQKGADDRAAWLELFGNEVYEHQAFAELVLDILDDVQSRFSMVPAGHIERSSAGWPVIWSTEEADRSRFLAQVRWFSSNHHKQFGKLLTPLVDGIRVSGPLLPIGAVSTDFPKLVLLDGQGLGHTATTASSISTRITQKFSSVDMILLVDNAQQPMQAAPLALLRAVGSSGYANKLAVAFTHFDQVKGANLGTFEQKREHVAASVTNAITSLRDQLGAGVAGALDRQIERQSVFLGGLDKSTAKLPVGFRRELTKLIGTMERASEKKVFGDCVAVYEFKGLEIALRDAIDGFRDPWRARLGLAYHDGIAKEHWTRVKALTRRLANGWGDEYDDLTPVADLLARLQEEASKWLDRPADWEGDADEAQRQAALDRIRQEVFSRLQTLTQRRLKNDQVASWRTAYDYSGRGSGGQRAKTIDDIHNSAAPHMSAAMGDDAREFLTNLYAILKDAIDEAGGKYRNITIS